MENSNVVQYAQLLCNDKSVELNIALPCLIIVQVYHSLTHHLESIKYGHLYKKKSGYWGLGEKYEHHYKTLSLVERTRLWFTSLNVNRIASKKETHHIGKDQPAFLIHSMFIVVQHAQVTEH